MKSVETDIRQQCGNCENYFRRTDHCTQFDVKTKRSYAPGFALKAGANLVEYPKMMLTQGIESCFRPKRS